jgi:hypothetical protein
VQLCVSRSLATACIVLLASFFAHLQSDLELTKKRSAIWKAQTAVLPASLSCRVSVRVAEAHLLDERLQTYAVVEVRPFASVTNQLLGVDVLDDGS